MKLKFRSSLSNFNKFNPFDSQTSDAKPIDLSLKSRIKNFMKKTNNEFKTSSDSINSIGSTNSSSNSLNNHFNYSNLTPINNSTINQINIPPSPPNSVEEDEEDCFQQQQFYYNQLINKSNYENHLQLTNLLNTSHLNQINKYSIENTANLLSIYTTQKINEQFLECNSDRFTNIPPSPVQLINDKSEQQQHIHYQKQMVRKHISQSTKQQRTQNHYNPYSQILKRKYAKQNLEDENEEVIQDLDYYDSNKLINKLRMKYCAPKVKQQSNNHYPILNDQLNQNEKNNLPIYNQISSSENSNKLINSQQNKLNSTNSEQLNSNLYNTNSLEILYKEYYNYLLGQPDSNIKLSALQILMKNALNQQNNKLNSITINQLSSNSPIDTHSLSSTPSPNSQINYNSDDIYSPRTPSSPKYDLLNDIPINLNQQEERKRSSRPLTGRHVRQGTGASPTTLANLKLAIKERQKSSSFKPIKRNKK